LWRTGGEEEAERGERREKKKKRKRSKKKKKKKKKQSKSKENSTVNCETLSLPFFSLSLSTFVPQPHFERVVAVVLLKLGLEAPVVGVGRREREAGVNLVFFSRGTEVTNISFFSSRLPRLLSPSVLRRCEISRIRKCVLAFSLCCKEIKEKKDSSLALGLGPLGRGAFQAERHARRRQLLGPAPLLQRLEVLLDRLPGVSSLGDRRGVLHVFWLESVMKGRRRRRICEERKEKKTIVSERLRFRRERREKKQPLSFFSLHFLLLLFRPKIRRLSFSTRASF